MRFYDRQKELQILDNIRSVAFRSASQFTVITGRRRVGKTKLILKSCEQTPTVYFFVGRSSESELCRQLSQALRDGLGVFVPEGINAFGDIFRLCMEFGKTMPYNLIIDEFQEFVNINPAVYSYIQETWDLTKDHTHVNFIVSGSVYSLMYKIFRDYKEPLYGRASEMIHLKSFSTSVIKQILNDYNPNYDNDSLLTLYALTGGVPKYVEMLMDKGIFTKEQMIEEMVRENSLFLDEGNIMLIQEFGKKYGNYYSILATIASGINEPARITDNIGQDSLGGSLARLEQDYGLIEKLRPIGAKPNSQTVRYVIKDHFLRFWFRFVVKNQNLVQAGKYNLLLNEVRNGIDDFLGHELEQYFKDKIVEEAPVEEIGSWWNNNRNGNQNNGLEQNEIDIVAKYYKQKKVLIAEVKRNKDNFKYKKFMEKVNFIRNKLFYDYEIVTKCLSLEDM